MLKSKKDTKVDKLKAKQVVIKSGRDFRVTNVVADILCVDSKKRLKRNSGKFSGD